MSRFVFPDNTVLCNFASVSRLGLLETVLIGRGRWTEAVADEAFMSSRSLPDLNDIPKQGWLGDPIEVDDDVEILQIERIRRAVFGGVSSQPRRHLGEAQTCFIMKNRPEFAGSWWVSDDREALRCARRQGLVTRETIDLIAIAVSNGDVTAREGYELLHVMAARDRHLRLPASVRDLM